jgi:hypothetical protein
MWDLSCVDRAERMRADCSIIPELPPVESAAEIDPRLCYEMQRIANKRGATLLRGCFVLLT